MTDSLSTVWTTGQQPARVQRAGRYLPISREHPAKMLPAIVTSAITAYTQPGDLVLDPMCGIGTTLVEATHLGRDAIGIEYEPAWADLAAANLRHARAAGATGSGTVLFGDARHLSSIIDPAAHGLVSLVVTSPPYGASLHGQVNARPGHGVAKSHDRYSRDRRNLAHQPLATLMAGFTDILTGCRRILLPGGVVAITIRPIRIAGELVDLPGQVTAAAIAAGLVPHDRIACLLAGVRNGRAVSRASFFQLTQARKARAAGAPRHVIAHEDLLIFRSPTTDPDD